jgi:hypothetical protein
MAEASSTFKRTRFSEDHQPKSLLLQHLFNREPACRRKHALLALGQRQGRGFAACSTLLVGSNIGRA